jgi:hypothetical protein
VPEPRHCLFHEPVQQSGWWASSAALATFPF